MEESITSYPGLKEIFFNRTTLIRKEFPIELNLIGDLIFHSFKLDESLMKTIVNEQKETGKPFEGVDAITSLLFRGTNHFLEGAFELALVGLNRPSYSLLRTVYENILTIYLLQLTDEESDLFVKKMEGLLSKKDEKKYWFKHFSPSKMTKRLYSGEAKSKLTDLYRELSENSHPNIRRQHYDQNLDLGESKKLLEFILLLGVANIWAFCEGFLEKLTKTDHEKTDDIIEKIGNHIKDFPNIIPDSPTLSRKPKIAFK